MGSWTTDGSSTLVGVILSAFSARSALIASSACLARACRSFFCWALEICRTGAAPTRLGGGELARERDAVVKEALSDGVAGC